MTLEMARLPLLLSFILLCIDFGGCLQVIVGGPVTFPAPGNCLTDAAAELHRVREDQTTRQVAARAKKSVWKPAQEYQDRVRENSSFTFSRTVYTDTGLYLLRCGGFEERIQLNVLGGCGASVTEGEQLTLKCYYTTAGKHLDSVRWHRNEETVLEKNLSSGEITYGSGFKGRASLPPDGGKRGDWSLVLDQAQLGDEGDYFCSVHNKGAREGWGDPAAVRVKVIQRKQEQTTPHPTVTGVTEEETVRWTIVAIIAAVEFIIVAPLFFLLGWVLKSRSCGRGQYTPVATPEGRGGPAQWT